MHAYIIGFHQGDRDMIDAAIIGKDQYAAINEFLERYKPEIRKTVGIAKITLFPLRNAHVRRHQCINSTNTVTEFCAKVAIGGGWLMYVRDDDGKTYLNRCTVKHDGKVSHCTIYRDDHRITWE